MLKRIRTRFAVLDLILALESDLFFWWWSSYFSWFGYYFFYDAISVPFLKAEEGFPNDWSSHGTKVWLLLYGLTENPDFCDYIFFVSNFIIDRVRHSIHLFYLEQIDLEQSPSFNHIWYRGAVPMERIKTIGEGGTGSSERIPIFFISRATPFQWCPAAIDT